MRLLSLNHKLLKGRMKDAEVHDRVYLRMTSHHMMRLGTSVKFHTVQTIPDLFSLRNIRQGHGDRSHLWRLKGSSKSSSKISYERGTGLEKWLE